MSRIQEEAIMTNIYKKIFGGLVVFLLLAGHCVAGEVDFIFAVASDKQEATGQVSKVAARAKYFLIFDNDGKLLETVTNPYTDARGGAGPSTVTLLAGKKVNIVVAGRFGSKMSSALKAADIDYFEKQGKVIDAIKGVAYGR